MKIERVDDKTVKCFLSNEELEEYEIDYKDFVLRSDKAREVVKEIIEQAEEEVGYKPPQFAFDLQIMVLPEQGLLLTLSEKEPFEGKDGGQIMEYIKQMKDVLQAAKEKIDKSVQAQSNNTVQGTAVQSGGEASQAVQKRQPDEAVFVFDSIGSVMEYAMAMPKNLRVQSELYGMGGAYYLYVKKGSASYERYSRACINALEFGSLYAADEGRLLLLKEHGECLIAERALKKLRLD